jgi:hypothetical protein
MIPEGHNRVRVYVNRDFTLGAHAWTAGRMSLSIRGPNPDLPASGGILSLITRVTAPLAVPSGGYQTIIELDPAGGTQLHAYFDGGMTVTGSPIYVIATSWAEGL